MQLQVILRYAKAPLIIDNIKWLSISKRNNKIYVGEHESKNAMHISIDDILALSVYDLSKGGEDE